MLTYPDESHGIGNRTNQIDFSIRMEQFFSHYLKGKPIPKWMAGDEPVWERSKQENFSLLPSDIKLQEGLNTAEDIQRQQEYLENKEKH